MRRLQGFNEVMGQIEVGRRKQADILSKVRLGIDLSQKEKAQYDLIVESERKEKERLNSVQNTLKKSIHSSKSETIQLTPTLLFSKFKEDFEKDGSQLVMSEDFKANLKTVMLYFLKDENFFKQKNLSSKTKGSFEKGLLIVGGYGNGKSTILKTLHTIFKGVKGYAFHYKNTNEVVTDYEHCNTPQEKELFFKPLENYRYCFDDLLTERQASNYGKVELFESLLEVRANKKVTTFVTCNYPEDNMSLEGLFKSIGMRYGARVYDRIFEMFNIIEFTGKSFRK